MLLDKKLHPKHEITIKGLVYDAKGSLLFLRDDNDQWDLPGGRMDHLEKVHQTLEREIKEEMGVVVKTMEQRPYFAEVILFEDAEYRFAVGYKITLSAFNFKTAPENRESKFVSKDELDSLNTVYKGMKDIKGLLYD